MSIVFCDADCIYTNIIKQLSQECKSDLFELVFIFLRRSQLEREGLIKSSQLWQHFLQRAWRSRAHRHTWRQEDWVKTGGHRLDAHVMTGLWEKVFFRSIDVKAVKGGHLPFD